MSDFLERQAWRALGRSPVIRPRLVSLYEAGPEDPLISTNPPESKSKNETTARPSGLNSIVQSSEGRTHSPEAGHHEQNPSSLSSTEVAGENRERPSAFSFPETDEQDTLKDRESGADLGRSSEPNLKQSFSVEAKTHPEKEVLTTNNSDTKSGASLEQSFLEKPDRGTTSNRSLGHVPLASWTRVEQTNPSSTLVEKETHVEQMGMKRQTIISQQAVIQNGIRPARINPPAIRPGGDSFGHSEPAVGKIQEATAAKQRPTINVTIGRVEIRAVTPPSSPPPPQRRAPRVSLEDYLNQKAGGGR